MKLIILFATFFLVHQIATGIDCPANCDCPNMQSAECKGVLEAPKGFNPEIRFVTISQTKIPILHNDSLDTKNFHELEELTIISCHVENVSANVFPEMKELTRLDLSDNNIKFLPEDAFKFNSKLRILILDSNPLFDIALRDVFLQSGSIRSLSMISCGIDKLPLAAFTELPKLSTLKLTKNLLEYLSPTTFQNSTELQTLDLRENRWNCTPELQPLINWFLGTFKIKPLYPNCYSSCNATWNDTLTCYSLFNKTTMPSVMSTDVPQLVGSRNLTGNLNVSINPVSVKEEIIVLKDHILILTIITLLAFVVIACVVGYLHRKDIKQVCNRTSNNINESPCEPDNSNGDNEPQNANNVRTGNVCNSTNENHENPNQQLDSNHDIETETKTENNLLVDNGNHCTTNSNQVQDVFEMHPLLENKRNADSTVHS